MYVLELYFMSNFRLNNQRSEVIIIIKYLKTFIFYI